MDQIMIRTKDRRAKFQSVLKYSVSRNKWQKLNKPKKICPTFNILSNREGQNQCCRLTFSERIDKSFLTVCLFLLCREPNFYHSKTRNSNTFLLAKENKLCSFKVLHSRKHKFQHSMKNKYFFNRDKSENIISCSINVHFQINISIK